MGEFGVGISVDRIFPRHPLPAPGRIDIPDRQNTTGLGKTGLLLNTTNTLLKDGRDLGGSSLGLSSVGADLLSGTRDGTGNSRANLYRDEKLVNEGFWKRRKCRIILNVFAKAWERIRGPIELGFEMERSNWRWTRMARMGWTHRGDAASGRNGRNGAAGLPQSVPEHYEGGFRGWEDEFSEGEM